MTGRPIHPNRADHWNRRGEEMMMKGKLVEAINFFSMSLDEDPEFEVARENILKVVETAILSDNILNDYGDINRYK